MGLQGQWRTSKVSEGEQVSWTPVGHWRVPLGRTFFPAQRKRFPFFAGYHATRVSSLKSRVLKTIRTPGPVSGRWWEKQEARLLGQRAQGIGAGRLAVNLQLGAAARLPAFDFPRWAMGVRNRCRTGKQNGGHSA